MKTKPHKITDRSAIKLSFILAAFITGLLPALVLIVTTESSFAANGTWVGNVGGSDGDWNFQLSDGSFESNWVDTKGNFVVPPNDPDDTATFESSGTTAVHISEDTTVNRIVFQRDPIGHADAFTLTVDASRGGLALTISGIGIANNSGQTQNFETSGGFESDGDFLAGTIEFTNSATAGNVTITNDGGVDGEPGGATVFTVTSNAGNAMLIANGGSGVSPFASPSPSGGGTIFFEDMSHAGNATLIANGGSGGGLGGTILFEGDSTGDTARVEVFDNGNLDIRSHNAPGVTVGSIEGNGNVFLGSNNLTVGSNNLSTLFSGVISDDIEGTGGSLTKVGTGTLTLSGDNTYMGTTTVNDGSLIVDVNGSISSMGTTTVNGGSLIVDGSISSAQTLVNAGGLLGGIGTIGGNVLNSGIVSPGDSPGTLTVAGGYTQTASGTLRIEVAGTAQGQFDLLAVGRHASLAGTLQLIPLGNFQLRVGDKITFLTAGGGVSGTFGTVQNPFMSNTLVKAEINILPNAVQLEGTQGSFTEVACNPNALAVAKALDSAVGDPRAAGLIDFLDTQPLSELCDDLNLISPEEFAAIFSIGVSLANIQDANLERRMDDIHAGSSGFSATGFSINTRGRDLNLGLAGPSGPEGKSGPSVMQPTPENRWGVFVTGIGEFTDVDSTDNASGYYLSTGGVTFGVDYRLSPNFAVGVMGGYAHTNGDLAEGGSLDVDGGKIGLYATAFSGGFYVNAAATGGLNDYDTHRTALLGIANGDTEGSEFTGLIAAGYDWKTGNLTVGPLASFQYTYVDFDGFTEHGSLAPLTFGDQSADSSRTALGAKASYDWHVGHVLVKPEIRAAWQHEFGDTDYAIVARFANGAGNSFTVTGPAIGRDSLLLGAGVAVLFNDRVSAYAYYDGELARTNYSSNNVTAGLRFTF